MWASRAGPTELPLPVVRNDAHGGRALRACGGPSVRRWVKCSVCVIARHPHNKQRTDRRPPLRDCTAAGRLCKGGQA